MRDLANLKHVASASRQVATYSAMNPILWKTAICSPVAMGCAVMSQPPLSYMFFTLACLPICVGSWGFVHFARSDPRRLQSEGHIEQMELIGKIADNKTGQYIEIDPSRAISSNQPEAEQ